MLAGFNFSICGASQINSDPQWPLRKTPILGHQTREARKPHRGILHSEFHRFSADLIYYKRLASLSPLQRLFREHQLHLESPRGGGRAERPQSCTQFSFKEEEMYGGGGRGRGSRSLQLWLPSEKERAGNVPGPPQLSNCSPAAVLPGHVSAG